MTNPTLALLLPPAPVSLTKPFSYCEICGTKINILPGQAGIPLHTGCLADEEAHMIPNLRFITELSAIFKWGLPY